MFTYLKQRNALARHKRVLKIIKNSNEEEIKLMQELAVQERLKIIRRLQNQSKQPLNTTLAEKIIIVTGVVMLFVLTGMIFIRLSVDL